MYRCWVTRFRDMAAILFFSFLIAACGQAAQSAVQMTPTSTAEPALTATLKPTQTTEIDLKLALPQGDPDRGFMIAASTYGCYGCHASDDFPDSGPRFAAEGDLPPIWERGEMRISLPEYTGEATTNMEYLIESVFLPDAYVVPGDWPNKMSPVYRLIMSDQDLADIIAWIATLQN